MRTSRPGASGSPRSAAGTGSGEKASSGGGAAKEEGPKVGEPGASGGLSGGGGNSRRTKTTPDADSFFRTELIDIRQRCARGEPVYAVFSVEDVLCDRRWRTLAIARAFDVTRDTRHFAGLALEKVASTAEETCRRLGITGNVRDAFVRHWRGVFGSARNFALDRPLPKLVSLVRAAEAAGADVIYLTARPESVRSETAAQLKRFGLPVRNEMLFTRPDDVSPEEFKRDTLVRWSKSRVHLSWFVTASRSELASVQQGLPSLPCVLLTTPWQAPSSAPIRNDTLILSLTE